MRRDVNDKDYPSKFYENLLMPEERRLNNDRASEQEKLAEKGKSEYILMERSYLKSWRDFVETSSSMVREITNLVRTNGSDVEGQLHALRGLSACKHEARETREAIISNLRKHLNAKTSTTTEAAIDGL